MTVAIQAQNVSKSYRVARVGPKGVCQYRTLRDDLVRWLTAPARLFKRGPSAGTKEFWALQDVCFDIQPGEVVGIIGRNGAGKSTLLKVLSRITRPTTGEVRLRGRVGSLLEVGTGFHPELTGRENIYLNGSILGMRRHEIARKFDQIVQFAGVEEFLETPVKRYSSGMYVRLAFAVAAYLEPEILIVDEVLAVGDMGFQRKCMARMHEVGRSGCTVLFVSHNMPAIEALCDRALLLDDGRVVADGDVKELVREYHRRVLQPQQGDGVALADRSEPGRKLKVYRSARLLDEAGETTSVLPLGGLFHLRLEVDAEQPLNHVDMTIGIDDTLGQRLLSLSPPRRNPVLTGLDGRGTIDLCVRQFPLAPGEYWIKLGLDCAGTEIDEIERVLHFSVADGEAFGEGRGIHRGVCVAPSHWTYRPLPEAVAEPHS